MDVPVQARKLEPRMAKLIAAIVLLSALTVTVGRVGAETVTVYSATVRGGITQTGNTLGLSHGTNVNGPGTRGSIGTFLTTDEASVDLVPSNPANPWFAGTTADWRLNASAARLDLPPAATVLHAELVWGGSFAYVEDVSANLDTSVGLTHESADTLAVAPDPATAVTLDFISGLGFSVKYYVRSADVTAFVAAAGPGFFEVSGVPATQHESDNSLSAAGWVLVVAYGLAPAPERFLEIRVGGEFVEEGRPSLSEFNGFLTPNVGAFEGRLLLAALEGDADQLGDRVLIEHASQSFTPLSGPGNPEENFFASQINNIDGFLDNLGTAGSRNHSASLAAPSSGGRQGWDVTGIPISSDAGHVSAGQTSTRVQAETAGDQFVLCAIALQLDLESSISSVGYERGKQTILMPCYPNPFNPRTAIAFVLPVAEAASLRIFDVAGRLIHTLLEDSLMPAGLNEVTWEGVDADGRPVPAGTYLYRLEAGGYSETKRMTLIK
jgi:hypothetical protein